MVYRVVVALSIESNTINLLISYIPLANHLDPDLDEFTYGDVGARARKLKRELGRGSFVFFHTSIGAQRYITGYFVVDRIMDSRDAAKDRLIVDKYRNPHIHWDFEDESNKSTDDVVIFGDPILSRKLDRPLLFDRRLAEKLSLGIKFTEGSTENERISMSTRSWRSLTGDDIKTLLDAIKENETQAMNAGALLSTEEVLEIREIDLENLIVADPTIIGNNLTYIGRQLQLGDMRLDLLFEDDGDNPVVVELKLNEIGKRAVNQLRGYMRKVRSDYGGRKTRGIIVCKGVLPAFVSQLVNVRDIEIFKYGWRLEIRKFESEP